MRHWVLSESSRLDSGSNLTWLWYKEWVVATSPQIPPRKGPGPLPFRCLHVWKPITELVFCGYWSALHVVTLAQSRLRRDKLLLAHTPTLLELQKIRKDVAARGPSNQVRERCGENVDRRIVCMSYLQAFGQCRRPRPRARRLQLQGCKLRAGRLQLCRLQGCRLQAVRLQASLFGRHL